MAVSKRLRYEILRRDGHTCRYCGAKAPDVPLRVDHVIPVALGGTDEPSNLVTACHDCNSGKTSTTPDAPLVANVADDALRWAAAMQQAAANLEAQEEPKQQYRDTFEKAWNGWTREHNGKPETFELPENWRTSLERFRQAGLPMTVWPDIVEKAMTNKTVRADNTFRYCCGIAWRMVSELQEEARAIVGTGDGKPVADIRTVILEAAFAVWRSGMSDNDEPPSVQQADEFRKSLAELGKAGLVEPERIIQAAQFATYFGATDITVAMRDMDRDAACRAWNSAWPTTWVPGDEPWDGKFVGGPSDRQREWVREQIDKLLDADVYQARIVRAASHAGSHKSARIYSGFTDDELKVTGVCSWQSQASELWNVAFRAAGEIEPTEGEISEFFASLRRIGDDGGFCLADVYEAASAAGSYRDPDVTTCLTRHLSVFEAAALPVGCEN